MTPTVIHAARRIATVLIILLMVGGLSACGRKGALQPPPQSAAETPAEAPHEAPVA